MSDSGYESVPNAVNILMNCRGSLTAWSLSVVQQLPATQGPAVYS